VHDLLQQDKHCTFRAKDLRSIGEEASERPHQIRIHLASIGHPLVGDSLYGLTGQPLENFPGLPGDGGYFLHAQYLNFHHPITGEQINLEAALPSGFSLHQ
jgi:23S rRNA pseudouridine1911/1915/1917 synthase